MNLWSLSFYFLSGSIGVTLLGWALALSPAFVKGASYGVALFVLAIGLGFILDDPITEATGLEPGQWYAILIGAAVAGLMGVAVLVGVLSNG